MRPNIESSTKHQGSAGGRKITMTIDSSAASMQVIMQQLTNLYKDPILAVIREYATNAWDAHQEAGINRPIEISLPSWANSTYIVKDYGVGMTADDLETVFSKFGASTKRDTDLQVGWLGYGCKSALAYTKAFVFTTVKDGQLAQAESFEDEDGTYALKIHGPRPTTQPNGTTVAVPVASGDIAEFVRKAQEFFRFWEPGSVTLDGVEPDFIKNSATKLTDDLYVIKDGDYRYNYGYTTSGWVVMGGVPYAAEFNCGNIKAKIIAYAPIGAINHPPNRETILDSKKTRAFIAGVESKVKVELRKAAQAELDAAANKIEARKVDSKWTSMGINGLKYKGQPIRHNADDLTSGWSWNPSYGNGRYNVSGIWNGVSFNDLDQGLIILAFDNKEFSTANRKKIKQYIEQKQLDIKRVYVTPQDTVISPGWHTGTQVTWADIKATKLPSKSYKPNDYFDVWNPTAPAKIYRRTAGDWEKITVDKINDGVVFSSVDTKDDSMRVEIDDVVAMFPGKAIICAPKNRWSKLMRESAGEVKDIETAAKELADALTDALTEEDKLLFALDGSEYYMRKWTTDGIDDPELVKKIELAKSAQLSDHGKRFKEAAALKWMPISTRRKEFSLFADYPLLQDRSMYGTLNENEKEYINALYAYKQGKGK